MKPSIRIAMVALVGALALVGSVWLSRPQVQAQPSASPYVPDLGDLMAATQLRHLKLAWAGDLQNWALAKYEAGEIRDSLAVAAKLYPIFRNVELAKLIADVSEPALKEIDDAIKAKNHTAVTRAFIKLTNACNSCHETAGFGFIAIRVPTTLPFSDQSFAPK